ncbi:MAG TPA: HD domain-containing protein [Terriglobales bacterium]|nr:HD domain-containing protein [Terriglobales bacterium]
MKDFFVREAPQHENQVITSSFVVATKQIRSRKDGGEPYLALTLADRTGLLEARMWENVAEHLQSFEQDDFLKVRGLISRYRNRYQITIQKLRRLEESEVDFADYLPRTEKNVDELWQTVGELAGTLQNPHLKALLEAFMADPEIAARYRQAPAAKSMHHAYLGGLLEHVVSLMKLCDLVVRNYPEIDRDLLLTGAFLHDIGKIYELSYEHSFSYTTRGQLLGHMIIELEMLQQKIALVPGFPERLKTLVEHLIISHHGQYEFGSPKLPMFPEALMLHYLDDLDSKMESMRSHLARDPNEGEWTGYNASLSRTLLKARQFLGESEPAGDETPSSPEEEGP